MATVELEALSDCSLELVSFHSKDIIMKYVYTVGRKKYALNIIEVNCLAYAVAMMIYRKSQYSSRI